MSFSVIQAGTALYMLDVDGNTTTLTLPTDVALRSDVPPRWTTFDRYVVLVNTPSSPLTIDGSGTVRLLTPLAPRLAPTLSGVTTGTLSGTYNGVRYTFITLDSEGNIISESDYSPASGSVDITSKMLRAAGLDISTSDITLRRLYRPTTSGAILFQWVDLDGNILTSIEDDLSDAGLSLVASPILGTPSHLTHIAEFRGRLFGVSDDDVDSLRYTEAGLRYSWPSDNFFTVQPAGADFVGVTALIGRRDALGIGRSNQLLQLTGTGAEDSSGSIDFDLVTLSKQLGVESQESVVVFRDTAYFLWKDGVYSWSSEGITCLSDGGSDGRGSVRSWFATDSYFNRERFTNAFAVVDPVRFKYRLYLAAAGSSTEDRWVEFDIKDRTWWGPHKTDLFSPTSAFVRLNTGDVEYPATGGSDGIIYQATETRTDGTSTAISMDVIGKRHDAGEADKEKYWGQLTLFGQAQTAGRLIIQSRVGNLNATRAKTEYYDMTKNRQLMGRPGVGKHLELEFTHATAGQQVKIFGYELDDVFLSGKR